MNISKSTWVEESFYYYTTEKKTKKTKKNHKKQNKTEFARLEGVTKDWFFCLVGRVEERSR